ncbi:hypothetical protein F5Y14DRAFT_431353 [Nemania sp. NC0429]|nr:hypothetical protein F5Y14DRAFT_431353 [Nemania sp. NC0429]
MYTKTNCFALVLAALSSLAVAEKGAAQVHGCVWHNAKPVKSYIANWGPGSTADRCMRLSGSQASMTVTNQGLTCQSLGKVAVDSSWTCFVKQSWWALSYTSDVAYSGSANSRWTTGPANSDITLHDQSPGTNVCASQAHCKGDFVEWGNDNDAHLYIVFEPGAVGDPGKSLSRDELEAEYGSLEDSDEPKLRAQELKI